MGIFDVSYCPNTECPNKDKVKKGDNCPVCGTPSRMFGISDAISLMNAKDHLKFEAPFIEAEKQGKRMVTINDSVLSADGIGKHLKLQTEAAQKYGYSLVNVTQTPAQFCIFMVMVFEKKEITPTKFVNCSYCKSRYDANQYFRCPNCGAT
jgi:hypothetical protein